MYVVIEQIYVYNQRKGTNTYICISQTDVLQCIDHSIINLKIVFSFNTVTEYIFSQHDPQNLNFV